MISESIPYQNRGAAYGVYMMFTSIPRTFSPYFGGIVMDKLGINIAMQFFSKILVPLGVVITLARGLLLKETLINNVPTKPQQSGVKGADPFENDGALQVFRKAPRQIYFMLLASCLFCFGISLAEPFIIVHATNVIRLTKTEWGMISMLTGLVSLAIMIPAGVLSDKIERKFTIITGGLLISISLFSLAFSTNFWHILIARLITSVGNSLGGYGYRGMESPAWQALIIDFTPSNMRGRILGFLGMAASLVSAPAFVIGGYLYDYFPQSIFISSFLFGILSTIIIWIYVGNEDKKAHA
jgi:MFS family permease